MHCRPVSPLHHLCPHSGDSWKHFFSSDNCVNNTNYCVVVLKCLALTTRLILANWTELNSTCSWAVTGCSCYYNGFYYRKYKMLTGDDVDDTIRNAKCAAVIFGVGHHLFHHFPRLAVVRRCETKLLHLKSIIIIVISIISISNRYPGARFTKDLRICLKILLSL